MVPLSPTAREVMALAQERAVQASALLAPAHIFLGLLDQGEVLPYLTRNGVQEAEARLYAEATLPKVAGKSVDTSLHKVYTFAWNEAWREASPLIHCHHLLIALVRKQKFSDLPDVLESLGFNLGELREQALILRRGEQKYPTGHPLNQASPGAEAVLDEAESVMRSTFSARIDTPHLMLALLADERGQAWSWLGPANVDVPELRQKIRALIRQEHAVAGPARKFTPAAQRALDRARDLAEKAGERQWEPEHLFQALLPQPISWRQRVKERYRFRGEVEDELQQVLEDSGIHLSVEDTSGEAVGLPQDCTLEAFKACVAAHAAATAAGSAVHAQHFLYGFSALPDSQAYEVLHQSGAPLQQWRTHVPANWWTNHQTQQATEVPTPPYSKSGANITTRAQHLCAQTGYRHIGVEHLLLAVLELSPNEPALTQALANVDIERARQLLGLENAPEIQEVQEIPEVPAAPIPEAPKSVSPAVARKEFRAAAAISFVSNLLLFGLSTSLNTPRPSLFQFALALLCVPFTIFGGSMKHGARGLVTGFLLALIPIIVLAMLR